MQDFFFFSLKQLETTTTGDRELNWMNSESNVITVSILPKKHDEVINEECVHNSDMGWSQKVSQTWKFTSTDFHIDTKEQFGQEVPETEVKVND